MKNTKDIINATASQLLNLVEMERSRIALHKDSNQKKLFLKMDFAEFMLQSLDPETVLTVEGCRGDGIIRDFNFFNVGSIGECVVKYHMTHEAPDSVEKTWSAEAVDAKNGWCDWEIKTAMTYNSLPTPSKRETTVLVNKCGVFIIPKAEVMQYTNKQGRLPFTEAVGTPIQWLMKKIGYPEE